MANKPLTVSSASVCAYKCALINGCVGAVLDGSSQCWLKSTFNSPRINAKLNLLLPASINGRPASFVNTANCLVTNITYNVIPGFDFSANNIDRSATPVFNCDLNPVCIGYKSAGYYKSDLQNPYKSSGLNLYVHTVQHGMYFILVSGWESKGGNIVNMPLTSTSACAFVSQCIVTNGCVGAVCDGSTHCWLKSFFNNPTNSSYNLLLPVGKNGCPPSYLHNGDSLCILTYNKIPNFDFSGNIIGKSNTPSSSCDSTATPCIGYNFSEYYKNDFSEPHVAIGMIFLYMLLFNNQEFILYNYTDGIVKVVIWQICH